MDMTDILLSSLFGLVGFAMFLYGKNNGRPVPLACGMGLMTFPMFIPNPWAMVAVCGVMMGAPIALRNTA